MNVKRLTVALAILALVGSLALWGWHRPPAAPTPPNLTETSKVVIIRLYADLGGKGVHIAVSKEGDICYLDEVPWLQTVVGDSLVCLWKPQQGE
jgi:hypothetical protein